MQQELRQHRCVALPHREGAQSLAEFAHGLHRWLAGDVRQEEEKEDEAKVAGQAAASRAAAE